MSPNYIQPDPNNQKEVNKPLVGLYLLVVKYYGILAIAISVLFIAIILFFRAQLAVSYHPDISGSERSSVMPIQQVVNDLPLYADPELPPYYIVQYTPLYFYVVGIPYKLLFDPSNIHRIYMASRVISLILVLLSTTIFFFILYARLKISSRISTLFTFLFFGLASYWNIYFSRVDSLLLVGTCTVLYIVAYGYGTVQKQDRYLLLALFIAVCVFFVKQSGLILVLVIAAHTFLMGEYRLLGKMILVGLVVFTAGVLFSNGFEVEVLYRNVILGVQNGISFDWFFYWTFDKLAFPFAVLITLSFGISFKWLTGSSNPFYRFLAISVFCFFGFALFTSLKQGAAVGYFIEFAVSSLIVLAIFFFKRREPGLLINSAFAGIVVISLLHSSLLQYMRYKAYVNSNYKQLYVDEMKVSSYIGQRLGENEFVFAQSGDNFKGYFIGHFLLNQTIAPMYDLVEIGRNLGTFNFQTFTSLTSEGKLKFVVTPEGEPIQPIMGDNQLSGLYDKVKTMNGYDIYEYRRASNLPTLQRAD